VHENTTPVRRSFPLGLRVSGGELQVVVTDELWPVEAASSHRRYAVCRKVEVIACMPRGLSICTQTLARQMALPAPPGLLNCLGAHVIEVTVVVNHVCTTYVTTTLR